MKKKTIIIPLAIVGVLLLALLSFKLWKIISYKPIHHELETFTADNTILCFPSDWTYGISVDDHLHIFMSKNDKDGFWYSDNVETHTSAEEYFLNFIDDTMATDGKKELVNKEVIKCGENTVHRAKIKGKEDNGEKYTAILNVIDIDDCLCCLDFFYYGEKNYIELIDEICASVRPIAKSAKQIPKEGIQDTSEALRKYNLLKENMTYDDVVKILGSEGHLLSGKETDDATLYQWECEGFPTPTILITFFQGKLHKKTQVGLE